MAEKARGVYMQAQGQADSLKQKVEGDRKRLSEQVAHAMAEEREMQQDRKAAREKEETLTSRSSPCSRRSASWKARCAS